MIIVLPVYGIRTRGRLCARCAFCTNHVLTKGVIPLKGMTPTLDDTATMLADIPASINDQSLRNSVRESLRQYFIRLEGKPPANLYEMVLAEVEQPMLEMVLRYTGQN